MNMRRVCILPTTHSWGSVYKVVLAIICIISSVLEVIALGRQEVWRSSLNNWSCEPVERPPIPGIFESFLGAGVREWLFAIGIPLILGLICLSISRLRTFIFFSTPLLGLHLINRISALIYSNQPWGVCGLNGDNVFSAMLIDIALVIFAGFGAPICVIISVLITRFRSRKDHEGI